MHYGISDLLKCDQKALRRRPTYAGFFSSSAAALPSNDVLGQAVDHEDIGDEGGDAGHDRLESEIDAEDQRRRTEG
jgi:hypothetical protein